MSNTQGKMLDKPHPIKVDYRERQTFEQIFKEHHSDLNIEWVNLQVGDFVIGEPQLCILERKTLCDMASSICDGRYREQKLRLAATQSPNLGYVVEGRVDMTAVELGDAIDSQKTAAIKTIMTRLQLSDRMACFNTADPKDTAALVAQIARHELPVSPPSSSAERSASYADVVHVKKSDNVTPRLIAVKALMGVMRVSSRIAESVLDEFKADTIFSLINALSVLEMDEVEKRMSDLKPNGTKRLGKPLAQAIIEALGIRTSRV